MKQVLIVTGASRGIGAATARLGAAAGYAVCVNYRQHREAADATVQAIRDAGGRPWPLPPMSPAKRRSCGCSNGWMPVSAR